MHTILYAGSEVPDPHHLSETLGLPVVETPRQLTEQLEHQHRHQHRPSHSVHEPADATTPSIVVPMSTGRDLTSITQAAQALRWYRDNAPKHAVAIADPPINATYAIAQYRHHLRRLAPHTQGIAFLSQSVDPFADAELFRRHRLAQQNSASVLSELAFEGAEPDLPTAIERLQLLGCDAVEVVRVDFGPARTVASTPAEHALYPAGALRAAIQVVAHRAAHLLELGEDGIAQALLADHDQGFAHSHGEEDGHSHAHTHLHAHAQSHSHGHSHPDGHSHPHAHNHTHPHNH